jgi:hypothetical protein
MTYASVGKLKKDGFVLFSKDLIPEMNQSDIMRVIINYLDFLLS